MKYDIKLISILIIILEYSSGYYVIYQGSDCTSCINNSNYKGACRS
jgi:hypothetical protein